MGGIGRGGNILIKVVGGISFVYFILLPFLCYSYRTAGIDTLWIVCFGYQIWEGTRFVGLQ